MGFNYILKLANFSDNCPYMILPILIVQTIRFCAYYSKSAQLQKKKTVVTRFKKQDHACSCSSTFIKIKIKIDKNKKNEKNERIKKWFSQLLNQLFCSQFYAPPNGNTIQHDHFTNESNFVT